ncbi:MAG: tetratricopeptide repeat protein [Acidobacteria bacterium]|nr:tetratricopeptide repeat protein [Acidobacteriota bacterium]
MTTGFLLALWYLWNDAGSQALDQRRYTDAAVAYRQAIDAAVTALPHNDPQTAMLWRNLSIAYAAEGMHRKAEDAAQRSLRILETRFGPADPSLVPSLNALGAALAGAGRFTEARYVFERAVELNLAGPHGATAIHNLGAMAHQDGRTDKARKLYHEAFRRRALLLGEDHPATIATHSALISLQGKGKSALARK